MVNISIFFESSSNTNLQISFIIKDLIIGRVADKGLKLERRENDVFITRKILKIGTILLGKIDCRGKMAR